MFCQDQIDHYYDQGYLITEAIDSNLLERLRAFSSLEAAKEQTANPNGNGAAITVAIKPGPIVDYLVSPHVLGAVQDLLGPEVHGLSLLLRLGHYTRSYKMLWHRDGMDRYRTVEEEMKILTGRLRTVQWHCALYDDDCFRFVPGSHRRPISAEELAYFKEDPHGDLPHQKVAELRTGETLYFNSLLLHQGAYKQGQRRETLAVGCRARSVPGNPSYHNHKQYMLEPGFVEIFPVELRPWLENSIKLIHDSKAGCTPKGDELGSKAYMEMVLGLDASD